MADRKLGEDKSNIRGGVAMKKNREETRMDVGSALQMVVGLACGTRSPGNMYCCSNPDGVGLWQEGIGSEYWLSADRKSGSKRRVKSKAKRRFAAPVACVSTADG